MSESGGKSSTGLQPNVAGLLCYLGWWITGIIFLIIEKENQTVRFHAMQSIVVFVALWILGILFSVILSFIPVVGWLIGTLIWILTVVLWIVLMYKAYRGEKYKVPVAGNIAESLVKPKS
jgi:uncharacterized membrane protein